jgi:hypothetical protein
LLPQHRLRLTPSAAQVGRAVVATADLVDRVARAEGLVVAMVVVLGAGRVAAQAGALAHAVARMAAHGGGETGMMAAVFL